MDQRYGSEVWNKGMERILQGGMERGYGTGVWNGCGPGACSGPPILTCTHIYIYICLIVSTWLSMLMMAYIPPTICGWNGKTDRILVQWERTNYTMGYHGVSVNIWLWINTYFHTIFRGWTSINPSYFDVNRRGTRFWHTAIYIYTVCITNSNCPVAFEIGKQGDFASHSFGEPVTHRKSPGWVSALFTFYIIVPSGHFKKITMV